jgi:alkyldihydroxyacetonephosphate synthase
VSARPHPVALPSPPHGAAWPTALRSARVALSERLRRRLAAACEEVLEDPEALGEAGRDWWPLGIGWAVEGKVPALPAAVVRPRTTEEVAAVLAACHDERVPVTPAAGRSGVCGGAVPVAGGVVVDLTAMAGITDLDDASLVAECLPGTFGPDLEAALRREGLTLGHWPQSMALSTVGGWVACRSAGQYSTRFGKIEDLVQGLQVVLADGTVVDAGHDAPRAAVGPDLVQLFVGSEGTLGVVTRARLRVRPVPPVERRLALGFPSFEAGLEACRRTLRRGGTPAVLRLYDEIESARHFAVEDRAVLVALDEAEEPLVAFALGTLEAEAEALGGERLDEGIVGRWMEARNDVSALGPLWQAGIVVDTVEIAARWSRLADATNRCLEALRRLPDTIVASVHQSHAYLDGACAYLTFAGRPDGGFAAYYDAAWDAVMAAALDAGAAISHHHGIGLNRARFVGRALGTGTKVLEALKEALDPRGILNPGKLGLRSPFGEVRW